MTTLREAAQQALEALITAEAGLADIGDADREPGDDLAWCEARAAEALAAPRAAITALKAALAEPVHQRLKVTKMPPRKLPEDNEEPDAYCVTTADGGCVSTDPRCMHNQIHSCSYYCTNFACIKAQRDELRDRLFGEKNERSI